MILESDPGVDPAIPLLKGIPKWFFGQVFFGGLGYQGQKTTLFQETHCYLAWYPRPPKSHLAKKTLRDPSEVAKIDDCWVPQKKTLFIIILIRSWG